jgi:hypothetical protein
VPVCPLLIMRHKNPGNCARLRALAATFALL